MPRPETKEVESTGDYYFTAPPCGGNERLPMEHKHTNVYNMNKDIND